jgi:hypothetical protein
VPRGCKGMTLKFLIDECLSPELVGIAVAHGHYESTCVRDRGWAGAKDYMLIAHAVSEDLTLVTCNSVDFRGAGPGNLGGEHAKQELHAGLVCLNSELPLDLDLQSELFRLALETLEAARVDLVNMALEVFHKADGSIECVIYDIPVSAAPTSVA